MPAELAIDVAALALYDVIVMAGACCLRTRVLTSVELCMQRTLYNHRRCSCPTAHAKPG